MYVIQITLGNGVLDKVSRSRKSISTYSEVLGMIT